MLQGANFNLSSVIQLKSVRAEVTEGKVRSPAHFLSRLAACHLLMAVGEPLGGDHVYSIVSEMSWKLDYIGSRIGHLPKSHVFEQGTQPLKVCFLK